MTPEPAGRRRRAVARPAATQVDVLPMFLGTGGHVRKDLPPMMERLRERHPSVRWRLHDAVGEQPRVREAMAAAALALLTAARCRNRSRRDEPAPVPLRPGGGAPQPQPDRDRQGAVHLAARHQQGDPRARGGARHRHLRAPRQAAAPRHRAGPGGAEVDRDHPARGRQPQAHRRGILQAGGRHAVDRHHAHAGALRAARAGGAAAPALPEGAGRAAPGHARAGGAHAAVGDAPTSAWPPNR